MAEVRYFDGAGDHTEECLEIVRSLAGKYKNIVVATTSGGTGLKFAERLAKKNNLVVITHSAGFGGPNKNDWDEEKLEKIRKLGAKVHTATILTSSIERSLSDARQGTYPAIIIADTYRTFGQGTKVAVEIVMMATDAGLIPEGDDVLSVAGTGRGADTVLVVRSATSRRFLDLKIREILAKPREW
jgi:hypothetical protein